MNIVKYALCVLIITSFNLKGFTQDELMDTTFNHCKTQILTIDEAEIATILQEVAYMCNRDGLDNFLVLQQLSDRIQAQMQHHARYTKSKWKHPLLVPAIVCASIGIGLVGLTYWIYKKWDAPLNNEFNNIVQELQPYSITVKEEHSFYSSYNHRVHNHIIWLIHSRNLSNAEREIIEIAGNKLLALRKVQDGWKESESIAAGLAFLSFLLSGNFIKGAIDSDPKDHQLCYEKYQLLLQKIASS